MMTLEEFTDEVYKMYIPMFNERQVEEGKEYFKSDEAKMVIRSQYNTTAKEILEGKYPESVMKTGAVGAAVSCLWLMF